MTLPRVTVCLVTCNQREFIAQSLLSVLGQGADADLRVLVGDDASDDGTSDIVAEIARNHQGKVEHVRRQERMGGYANMRDLIMRADGDFIARVDGDDYWLPGKLQRQLDCMQAHPDYAAIYTNAITVDPSGRSIGRFNDVGDARFDLASLLRRGNFLNNSSVLFRSAGRDAWLEVEGPQIDYRVHLWHARNGLLAHIGEPLTAYRVGVAGSMVSGMNEHVRELYWEAIRSVPRERISDLDYARGIADFLRRVAFRSLSRRNPGLFLAWQRKTLSEAPFGRIRMALLVCESVVRSAAKLIWLEMSSYPPNTGRKVLYPR